MAPLDTFSSPQNAQDSLTILSDDDKTTLYFIAGYSVGIFILWNFPILQHLLTPFKLLVTAVHEFGHASVGFCTGGRIHSLKIELNTEGCTQMKGGNPYLALPAGYLGSSFYGGLMVFAGFNIIASKVVAIILGICFLLVLYWAKNWLTRIISVLFMGAMGVLWWFEGGKYLPYAILFVGVMCSLQSLWDFQGLIFFKHPQSDATKFAELCGCCPGQVWALIWMLIGLVLMAGFAILGVMVF
jgi:hypothetical protein